MLIIDIHLDYPLVPVSYCRNWEAKQKIAYISPTFVTYSLDIACDREREQFFCSYHWRVHIMKSNSFSFLLYYSLLICYCSLLHLSISLGYSLQLITFCCVNYCLPYFWNHGLKLLSCNETLYYIYSWLNDNLEVLNRCSKGLETRERERDVRPMHN